jgi:hypothetical protein
LTATNTTASGEVNLTGPVYLYNSVTIDTTGNSTVGSEINLWQSVDDANAAGTDSLTLNAGTNAASGTDSIIRVWYGGIGQTTPIGAFEATAGNTIAIYGGISTAGGAITLNGPTQIYNSVLLSTTAAATLAGAGITFNGRLDDTTAFTDTLTLTSGTAGNVTFAGPVGATEPLGPVTITRANNVMMTTPYTTDPLEGGVGFAAQSLTVEGPNGIAGANNVTADSFISTMRSGRNSGESAMTRCWRPIARSDGRRRARICTRAGPKRRN